MRHAYCANLHAFASPLAVLFMRVHKRPDILLLLRGILVCAIWLLHTRLLRCHQGRQGRASLAPGATETQ